MSIDDLECVREVLQDLEDYLDFLDESHDDASDRLNSVEFILEHYTIYEEYEKMI